MYMVTDARMSFIVIFRSNIGIGDAVAMGSSQNVERSPALCIVKNSAVDHNATLQVGCAA